MNIELSEWVVGGGIITIASASMAFGVVRGKLYNYVSHEQHGKICHQKSTEVYGKFNEIVKQQGEILRAIGRIEGKLNGGLK